MNRNALLLLAALAGPSLLTAGCETTAQAIQGKENNLAAAGFVDRPANTPVREAMLSKLPPNKFVRRVHGDNVSYVYADPTGCHCLYVGTQQAYAAYRRQQQAQNIADENQLAAAEYQDSTWNWGAWGGPFYSGFGWGPGFGW